MASCLNCYNFRTIKAINVLFSALYTTSFVYGKVHFGVLNMLHASIATSNAPGVLTRHNFRQEYSNRSKFGLYIERSLSYWNVLFINLYAIHYGDTVEQTTCTFSRSIPANDLGKLRPTQSMGRQWLYYWRESSGKTCKWFVQLYLCNGWHKNL